MKPEDIRLLPVLVPVTLAGAVVAGLAAASVISSGSTLASLSGLLALLVAATIAEAFPVPIEGVKVGKTSLATVFIVATAVVYGWASAALLALVAMTVVEVGRRRPPSRVTYNASLYALAAAGAGLAAAVPGDERLVALALGALFGSSAFYLVNIALLAAVVARAAMTRAMPLFWHYVYWTAAPFGIMASLTVILVVLWDRSPFVAIALTGPLVALALYERSVHRALDRLRELGRLKDEFIAVVSHELRTPVASVYGAAMTLQRDGLDRTARDSMLSVIFRESERLARMVDQVLLASGLESGSIRMTVTSCDPAGLAAEVVDAARAHLPDGFELKLSGSSVLSPVAVDAEKVKRVLGNLVENAIKYSPEGGRIEVGVAATDGAVCFSVSDQGLGIPADEQARIFEKFHRLDPNLSRGVAGTGLGLYICRELIREMDGRIWVTSEEGKGSTFSFVLPLASVRA